MPSELDAYRSLLLQCGVRERFGDSDFVGALERIGEANGDRPLGTKELTLAIELVLLIKAVAGANAGRIFIPDERGAMADAKLLVFDDAPWLSASLSHRHRLRFAHKDVPNEQAELCGAQSLRKQVVGGNVRLQDLPCPSSAQLASTIATNLDTLSSALFDILELADVMQVFG